MQRSTKHAIDAECWSHERKVAAKNWHRALLKSSKNFSSFQRKKLALAGNPPEVFNSFVEADTYLKTLMPHATLVSDELKGGELGSIMQGLYLMLLKYPLLSREIRSLGDSVTIASRFRKERETLMGDERSRVKRVNLVLKEESYKERKDRRIEAFIKAHCAKSIIDTMEVVNELSFTNLSLRAIAEDLPNSKLKRVFQNYEKRKELALKFSTALNEAQIQDQKEANAKAKAEFEKAQAKAQAEAQDKANTPAVSQIESQTASQTASQEESSANSDTASTPAAAAAADATTYKSTSKADAGIKGNPASADAGFENASAMPAGASAGATSGRVATLDEASTAAPATKQNKFFFTNAAGFLAPASKEQSKERASVSSAKGASVSADSTVSPMAANACAAEASSVDADGTGAGAASAIAMAIAAGVNACDKGAATSASGNTTDKSSGAASGNVGGFASLMASVAGAPVTIKVERKEIGPNVARIVSLYLRDLKKLVGETNLKLASLHGKLDTILKLDSFMTDLEVNEAALKLRDIKAPFPALSASKMSAISDIEDEAYKIYDTNRFAPFYKDGTDPSFVMSDIKSLRFGWLDSLWLLDVTEAYLDKWYKQKVCKAIPAITEADIKNEGQDAFLSLRSEQKHHCAWFVPLGNRGSAITFVKEALDIRRAACHMDAKKGNKEIYSFHGLGVKTSSNVQVTEDEEIESSADENTLDQALSEARATVAQYADEAEAEYEKEKEAAKAQAQAHANAKEKAQERFIADTHATSDDVAKSTDISSDASAGAGDTKADVKADTKDEAQDDVKTGANAVTKVGAKVTADDIALVDSASIAQASAKSAQGVKAVKDSKTEAVKATEGYPTKANLGIDTVLDVALDSAVASVTVNDSAAGAAGTGGAAQAKAQGPRDTAKAKARANDDGGAGEAYGYGHGATNTADAAADAQAADDASDESVLKQGPCFTVVDGEDAATEASHASASEDDSAVKASTKTLTEAAASAKCAVKDSTKTGTKLCSTGKSASSAKDSAVAKVQRGASLDAGAKLELADGEKDDSATAANANGKSISAAESSALDESQLDSMGAAKRAAQSAGGSAKSDTQGAGAVKTDASKADASDKAKAGESEVKEIQESQDSSEEEDDTDFGFIDKSEGTKKYLIFLKALTIHELSHGLDRLIKDEDGERLSKKAEVKKLFNEASLIYLKYLNNKYPDEKDQLTLSELKRQLWKPYCLTNESEFLAEAMSYDLLSEEERPESLKMFEKQFTKAHKLFNSSYRKFLTRTYREEEQNLTK